MILVMGFEYGTKYTKTHDIFLILFMIGYWEIDVNIDEPLIVHLVQEFYKTHISSLECCSQNLYAI